MALKYALAMATLALSAFGQTLAPLEFADQGKIYL